MQPFVMCCEVFFLFFFLDEYLLSWVMLLSLSLVFNARSIDFYFMGAND
jgi:hypothetical protein